MHRWTTTPGLLGESVGNYRIDSKLAEGGMGAVYRATHQLLGKPAAVKVLLPELSTNREIVNRFFNEARAATSVRHPGIVEIFDFGYMANDIAYIVMEFLDGEPLSRRLATKGRLDEGTALLFVRGIASALAAAHAQGIVHRDLKPDNVFLVPDPDMPTGVRPKLLDFGIAKVAEAVRGTGEATKTRTGSVMGTPTYMSPEQCRGAGDVDARSDLYSLGCILYEMLVGRPPFDAEGLGEIIGAHQFLAPTPPRQLVADISANLEALTLCLLAKKPEERVQSAAELVRLLGQGSVPNAVVQATIVAPRLVTGAPVNTPTTLSSAAGSAVLPSETATKKSRAGLWVGLAIAAVVGGGGAIFLGTRSQDAPPSESITQPATAPAPAPEPTPPTDEVPTAPTPVIAAQPSAPAAVDAGVGELALDAAVVEVTTPPDAGAPLTSRKNERRPERKKLDTKTKSADTKTKKADTGATSSPANTSGVDRGD